MRVRGLLIVGLIAAGALAGRLYSVDFFAADSCLDRGGSYHYDRGECSFTHDYEGEVPSLSPF